jgi:hypothetical protein
MPKESNNEQIFPIQRDEVGEFVICPRCDSSVYIRGKDEFECKFCSFFFKRHSSNGVVSVFYKGKI